ncbi:HAD family hydrolase [Filimonas effusa]|uniref:phosphoglycolate phosphatase n=1 Tax=Filimonas effusa TaxID=2508721 RepID=A0A4Q1DCT4_9BACT|nr:HAD hydrolase-like protein [Filimonas effusa]RXK87344.1 HAD family hydrolase [Filimonas effusa]
MFSNFENLLWDFDGVIMDSMPIRSKGFEITLSKFPDEQVANLIAFHNLNGGLSRYVKFRYFFEQIRGESITEEEVLHLADQFSQVMLELLIDVRLLITDSLDFIRSHYKNFNMHIVSGSDGNELRHICSELDIAKYFKSIEGSPVRKNVLVKNLIELNGYDPGRIVLVGDSINDLEASEVNSIAFYGYNNVALHGLGKGYVNSFNPLDITIYSIEGI